MNQGNLDVGALTNNFWIIYQQQFIILIISSPLQMEKSYMEAFRWGAEQATEESNIFKCFKSLDVYPPGILKNIT